MSRENSHQRQGDPSLDTLEDGLNIVRLVACTKSKKYDPYFPPEADAKKLNAVFKKIARLAVIPRYIRPLYITRNEDERPRLKLLGKGELSRVTPIIGSMSIQNAESEIGRSYPELYDGATFSTTTTADMVPWIGDSTAMVLRPDQAAIDAYEEARGRLSSSIGWMAEMFVGEFQLGAMEPDLPIVIFKSDVPSLTIDQSIHLVNGILPLKLNLEPALIKPKQT